jgi:hypothetical protein
VGAAVGEQEFIDYLADNGWSAEWVSILEQDASMNAPDQTDAATWASDYDLDPTTVLYDASQTWAASAAAGGFPTVYTVHTSNMLIWDKSEGWISPSSADWDTFLEWWPDFLDYCAVQPGAID